MAKNNLNENQEASLYVDPKVRRKQLEDAWIIAETMRQKKKMTPKKFKKFINKEINKKFTLKQKVAKLGGAVVGAVSSFVGWAAFIDAKADSNVEAYTTDANLQYQFYQILKEQYSDYAKEKNINLSTNDDWANNLATSLAANGREAEGNLLLDLYNQAESGNLELGSLTEWLEDNGLSQYFNENTDQLIKDSYVQAYQEVYGTGPVTQSNLLSWINSFYGDQSASVEFNNMILLLVKTDSSMVKVYNATELNNKVLELGVTQKEIQDANLKPGDLAYAARDLLCNQYAESHGLNYVYGVNAASNFVHAAMESGNAQDMADVTTFLNDFMAYSTTVESYEGANDMLPSQVLKEFGYDGDLIGLMDNLENNDYVFASVMENKYDGVDCLKSDGTIDFNNTGNLSGQELANYQQDVANYENWSTDGQNVDFTTWLQHEGYYDQIVDQWDQDAHTYAAEYYAPVAIPSIIIGTIVGLVLVKKYLTNKVINKNEVIEEILKEHGIDPDGPDVSNRPDGPNKPGKPSDDDSDDYFPGSSIKMPVTDSINIVDMARR